MVSAIMQTIRFNNNTNKTLFYIIYSVFLEKNKQERKKNTFTTS